MPIPIPIPRFRSGGNCATDFPDYPECWACDYPDYDYNYQSEALLALAQAVGLRASELRQGADRVAYDGPCEGKGRHINYYRAGTNENVGSISSCDCCDDEPEGPQLNAKWRIHPKY